MGTLTLKPHLMTQATKKKLVFTAIFAVLSFIAFQIPLTQLVGSKVKFTLFDTFAPIASGLLGTIPGIVAVLVAELANFFIHGARVVDGGTIIRFFPMLFAAWYFAKPRKVNIIIPILAIIAFNLNPIGRSAWYFSLFWLIPIACEFLRDKSLLARSLGATFTAHAVGGAAWVWTFGLTKEIWTALIPVVALERSVFAVGIAATYLAMNNILAVLDDRKVVKISGLVNEKLVWKKLLQNNVIDIDSAA